MSHIRSASYDVSAPWKTQIRERVMKNLDVMLKDARTAYHRKLSENVPASTEVRYRLQNEYNQDVQNLRYIAEEEVRAEIEREERERRWCADSRALWDVDVPEQLGQAFVEEQLAILNAIKNQPRLEKVVVQEYNGSLFEQGSSSRPIEAHPSRPSAVHSRSGSLSQTLQVAKVETTAEKEARLRLEKHEKQQEEFRKRAEEIQQRKRLQREWNNRLDQLETTSSSSSSSSMTSTTSSAPTSATPSPSSSITSEQDCKSERETAPAMSEEDVINLVIFHDQQWTWISSLPHLQWSDFPWPYLSFSAPKRKEDLTVEAVSEYVVAPLNICHDRAIVKDRLKDLIRKWHPDRFEVKYLALIADSQEREMVREGAGVVARILNDLLGKWNDQ
ncbi:unnamed protein product [Cyclocybe aegerita]|uniref:Uncharacterized protein n=1 Tax=Cyclocybe aegerita TaxID=1973307 RepID=A0A8S0WIY6_CYCAE|nr:unnamed protein product [Cyclocybe aegerita]